MLGQASSPILAKAEAALVAKIPAALRGDFQKLVHAGLAILYAPQLKAQLQQKLTTTDPVQSAAQGCVNLIGELWKQSKFTIPKPLLVPAMLVFAFEYLDLAQNAGKLQVTPQIVAQVTQQATQAFLTLTGAQKQQPPGLVAGAMPPAAQPAMQGAQ